METSSEDGLIVRSERLDLVAMTQDFMESAIAGDFDGAATRQGLSQTPRFEGMIDLFKMRLKQLHDNPDLQPWLARSMVLRESGIMVGHIGFHGAPDATYLLELGLSGAEIGYSVFPPYRRKGYAGEAVSALMGWANRERGIATFVASISPSNNASLALTRRLGFEKVSSHIDPVDGYEDIFVLDMGEGE